MSSDIDVTTVKLRNQCEDVSLQIKNVSTVNMQGDFRNNNSFCVFVIMTQNLKCAFMFLNQMFRPLRATAVIKMF